MHAWTSVVASSIQTMLKFAAEEDLVIMLVVIFVVSETGSTRYRLENLPQAYRRYRMKYSIFHRGRICAESRAQTLIEWRTVITF